MWKADPTPEFAVGCRPPFSFYFDLVERYWTSEFNNPPIHRICTLARKQGATFFTIEDVASQPAIEAEIAALDFARGPGGTATAMRLSFFSSRSWPANRNEVPLTEVDLSGVRENEFLGQAVIVSYRQPGSAAYDLSYIFEALFPSPRLPSRRPGTIGSRGRELLNNFIYTEEKFVCEVRDRQFEIIGLYYCQQNSLTHVCAHASLRMALNSETGNRVTPDYVNQLLKITPPCDGLTLPDLVRVIQAQGKHAEVIKCQKRSHGKYKPVLSREAYISVLASIVESGHTALLTFSTAGDGDGKDGGSGPDHVVFVYGHTRHSDEWHPQAIAAYAGPVDALYFPASNWIDHFLIHDDNFGPYYTLSSSALEFKKEVTAHKIIAIRDIKIGTASQFAEGNAAAQLANVLPRLKAMGSGRWFEYLTSAPRKFVLRTILIQRKRYLSHLRAMRGHDSSRMSASEIEPFGALPERFWMVEFSLPPLFTGNHSKLGEVIISADTLAKSPDDATILALRLPSLSLVRDTKHKLLPYGSSLRSHAEIFRIKRHAAVW